MTTPLKHSSVTLAFAVISASLLSACSDNRKPLPTDYRNDLLGVNHSNPRPTSTSTQTQPTTRNQERALQDSCANQTEQILSTGSEVSNFTPVWTNPGTGKKWLIKKVYIHFTTRYECAASSLTFGPIRNHRLNVTPALDSYHFENLTQTNAAITNLSALNFPYEVIPNSVRARRVLEGTVQVTEDGRVAYDLHTSTRSTPIEEHYLTPSSLTDYYGTTQQTRLYQISDTQIALHLTQNTNSRTALNVIAIYEAKPLRSR